MARNGFGEWLRPEGLALIEGWAREGVEPGEIARRMGLSPAALERRRRQFPQVDEALRRTREAVDCQVEAALLKRALGYEAVEERSEDKDGRLTVVRTVKHVPGDVHAQIFWLQCREPKKYREESRLGTPAPEIRAAVEEFILGALGG